MLHGCGDDVSSPLLRGPTPLVSREYDINDFHECSLDFLETSNFHQFSSKVPHTRRLDPDLGQISTRPRSSDRPRPTSTQSRLDLGLPHLPQRATGPLPPPLVSVRSSPTAVSRVPTSPSHCKPQPPSWSNGICLVESSQGPPEKYRKTFLFYLNGCATLIKGLLYISLLVQTVVYLYTQNTDRRPRGDG